MHFSEKENIVDPNLERVDPTPSIYDLFRQFNQRFFWDKLNMVEVSWSGKQMTSCAGLCSYHPRSGHCHIKLSAPLLTLRPRKDLVETLLHEMIHAFLFVTHNNKDRNDHGPEFHKHMYRINAAAGTNITVYHTFNDEVRSFQAHVWRCNGPCQKVGPFFGVVRRAMNRAPGPSDKWWSNHKQICSGTFEKIEEPPGFKSRKKKAEKKVPGSGDLQTYFPPVKQPTLGSNIHTFQNITSKGGGFGGGHLKNKGSSTVVSSKATTSKDSSSGKEKPTSKPPAYFVGKEPPKNPPIMKGTVNKVTSVPTPKSSLSSQPKSSPNVNEHVRNVWANKFSQNDNKGQSHGQPQKRINENSTDKPKQRPSHKRKYSDPGSSDEKKLKVQCDQCQELVDDLSRHREVCSSRAFPCPVCNQSIKNSSLEEHLNFCLSDSFTEDIFASEVIEPIAKGSKDIEQNVNCPVCGIMVVENIINAHIDECLTLKALPELFPS